MLTLHFNSARALHFFKRVNEIKRKIETMEGGGAAKNINISSARASQYFVVKNPQSISV